MHFPDLWAQFFVKIHSLMSCFGTFGVMGMIFRKFSGFISLLLRNFSAFMGGTFII